MSRAKMPEGRQREFLESAKGATNLNWQEIANISNICERTLWDWRREKINMSYEALCKLHRISKISIPKNIEILPEYWSTQKAARVGAKRRYELYGNPGTPQGRSKGGVNSQRKFRLNPEYARKKGIKIRKEIRRPTHSPLLAEFIGIVLGDGGITDYQVCITFNTETDKAYSAFLQRIVKSLFSISSVVVSSRSDKGDNVVISSKNLVEFLECMGLKRGNKIHNKADLPKWIWQEKDYQVACMRGLMDTDGSFYSYNHKVYKKTYHNFAMCLTNYSKPLLNSAFRILKNLNFNPVSAKHRIYLHRQKEINRYFAEIGTHNSKHFRKYNDYIISCNVGALERYRSGHNGAVLKTV